MISNYPGVVRRDTPPLRLIFFLHKISAMHLSLLLLHHVGSPRGSILAPFSITFASLFEHRFCIDVGIGFGLMFDVFVDTISVRARSLQNLKNSWVLL